jgi:hypothetical protein
LLDVAAGGGEAAEFLGVGRGKGVSEHFERVEYADYLGGERLMLYGLDDREVLGTELWCEETEQEDQIAHARNISRSVII